MFGKIRFKNRIQLFEGQSIISLEDSDHHPFDVTIPNENIRGDYVKIEIVEWHPGGFSLIKFPGEMSGFKKVWVSSSRIIRTWP